MSQHHVAFSQGVQCFVHLTRETFNRSFLLITSYRHWSLNSSTMRSNKPSLITVTCDPVSIIAVACDCIVDIDWNRNIFAFRIVYLCSCRLISLRAYFYHGRIDSNFYTVDFCIFFCFLRKSSLFCATLWFLGVTWFCCDGIWLLYGFGYTFLFRQNLNT